MAEDKDGGYRLKWLGQYVLEGKLAVPEYDPMTWACWMEKADRKVARTVVGDFVVSTVFLGLDHNLLGREPHLFETMIFTKDGVGDYQRRYTTWKEAMAGHEKAVRRVRRSHLRLIGR